MAELTGLKEYLNENYDRSVFDQAMESRRTHTFHMHGRKIIRAAVTENLKYDIKTDYAGDNILPKIEIKFLHPSELDESLKRILKEDQKVKGLDLKPLVKLNPRFFIKNKTLFPLMMANEVLFFTLLEGDLIRGVISGFSRYEITVKLKGGIPLTILRHGIYDLRNKKGRCFLKSFQEEHRDWQKSELYR